MKVIYTSVLSAALMMTSAAFSQECSGELMVPELTCINAKAGSDVRLYITEFQTCENGKITELDRTILGLHVLSKISVEDIHTIDKENIEITYAPSRTMIDPHDRGDFLSFLMPREVKMIDGSTTIEMTVTDQVEPDYEGASTNHFKGSFKITKENGKIVKGKLACSVNR